MKQTVLITIVLLSFFTSLNAQTRNIETHKANFAKGQEHLDNGNYSIAIRYFTDALETGPNDKILISSINSILGRGLAKVGLADSEGAIADFNMVLTIVEHNDYKIKYEDFIESTVQLKQLRARAYFGKGLAYRDNYNLSAACENFEEAAKLGMKDMAYKYMQDCPY